uniref:Venom protein n=1 Tax=Ampulex compressa TaxID=860918 RepID=A0A1W6EW12_AMPCP|nr:venom protein [Ampulex compressa]
MLKAEIVLWLLASIYGLEIANVVKRDVNIPPDTLKEIQKDVKEKVNYLLLDSATDWKDTYVILSIMHRNASLLFQTKLTQELDNVRLAVQTARENGTDVSYCIEGTNNTLQAFRQDAELKFTECKDVGWKDFMNNYDIITKILQTGYRVLEEITTIQKLCFLRISYVKICNAQRFLIVTQNVHSFNKKLKFHPLYRKLVFLQLFDKYTKCLKTYTNEGMKKVNAFRPINERCVNDAE